MPWWWWPWTTTESSDTSDKQQSSTPSVTSSSSSSSWLKREPLPKPTASTDTSISSTYTTTAAHLRWWSIVLQEHWPLFAAVSIASFSAGALSYGWAWKYARRIKTAGHLSPENVQSQRRLKGVVLAVGDSDNFRLVHTPLPGQAWWWKWRLWRDASGEDRKYLSKNTIHIRLAGIDAPESSAFGMPKQKYTDEAKEWLRRRLLHRIVHVQVHRRDQYQRLVGTVWRPSWLLWRKNVSLEMLQAGWAVVYDSAGAEYNGMEEAFRNAEVKARKRRIGMWKNGDKDFVHPADHKKQHLR